MRIFFIGYMGAGKSHTAKRLEEATGRRCVDLDTMIEEHMGLSIEAAFAQRGEAFFRNQEALVLDHSPQRFNDRNCRVRRWHSVCGRSGCPFD